MLSKNTSCSVLGIAGFLVQVEVDVSAGLPSFSTVGLPDNTIRESKDRVKAAIKNSGFEFPNRRITVNLAPADLKKEGAGFDLPIAITILEATGTFTREYTKKFCVVGELSLDGQVQPIKGILPMILAAENSGLESIIIPEENRNEAQIASKTIDIICVSSLSETLAFLAGKIDITSVEHKLKWLEETTSNIDFSDIRGQEHVIRAMEIGAAGGHNILLRGAPGGGKTMLAHRFATILPAMTRQEILETSKIYSVTSKGENVSLPVTKRPFRSPHHTISDAGLIGGGTIPQPGEVSLANNGVLFLDELPEFRRHVLEVLRQPIEDGIVTISRANMTLSFPSRFILIAAMNPCPCGYYGDKSNRCNCTPTAQKKYRHRISGPLLDRIDMHLEVPSLNYKELQNKGHSATSEEIRDRVNIVRDVQTKRFHSSSQTFCNGQMSSKEIEKYCVLDQNCSNLLEKSVQRLHLSARSCHRILKMSRTIADLDNNDSLAVHHLAEAIQLCRGNAT